MHKCVWQNKWLLQNNRIAITKQGLTINYIYTPFSLIEVANFGKIANFTQYLKYVVKGEIKKII